MVSIQLYGASSPSEMKVHYDGVLYEFTRDGAYLDVPAQLASALVPGSAINGTFRVAP